MDPCLHRGGYLTTLCLNVGNDIESNYISMFPPHNSTRKVRTWYASDVEKHMAGRGTEIVFILHRCIYILVVSLTYFIIYAIKITIQIHIVG